MPRAYSRSPIPTLFAPRQSEGFPWASESSWLVFGRWSLPWRVLFAVPILYLMAGIFLPSLWRGVDANTYSVLLGMNGDGFFQGELFQQSVSSAPAYYRLLDFGARLFGGLIGPVHGMRLTHSLLILGGLFALYNALRTAFSHDIALFSVLLCTTCLGGLEFMHLVSPKTGAFFAINLTLWGLALSFKRSVGGVISGLGFALSLMMGTGTLLPTLIPALILWAYWRNDIPSFRMGMSLALSMMGVTLLSLFVFTGRSALEVNLWWPRGGFESMGDFLNALLRQVWFTFPLWPALFAFRYYSRKQWSPDSLRLMFLGAMGALFALPLALPRSDGSMMLLPFLSLLFAPALLLLTTTWLRGWHWFNFLFFSMTILPLFLVRLLWGLGMPSSLAEALSRQAPGFDPALSWFSVAVATLIVMVWLMSMVSFRSLQSWTHRPLLGWVMGVVSLWWVFVLLWLPAIDYGKSYTQVIQTIRQDWQAHTGHMQQESQQESCINLHQAPFALQVNWRLLEPINRSEHCTYRLISVGRAERQSLLISDAQILKEESEGGALPANRLEERALIDEMGQNTSAPSTTHPAQAPTAITERWHNIGVYQRPGDDKEHIVLQKRVTADTRTRRARAPS